MIPGPFRNLALIGFMGAGKTTAARRIGKLFGVEVIDADAVIAEKIGMPIDRCFAEQGEAAFRAIEAELVGEMLEAAQGGPDAGCVEPDNAMRT